MRLVDLFAGIGGFSYAADQLGITTEVFVEKEKYCQKVLDKNFPGVPIVDDIFDFNIDLYEEYTGKRTTDIICGGFPCQPFSLAGQRKGTEDDRHLWPQMFRVISELKPRWVIAENVYGLLNIQNGLVFDTVCSDLESEGYEVQTFIIPAASKNAPHKRDRLWIVANSANTRIEGMYQRKECTSKSCVTPNASTIGCDNWSDNRQERSVCKDKYRDNEKDKSEWDERLSRTSKNNKLHVTDSDSKYLQGSEDNRKNDREGRSPEEFSGLLPQTWLQFPTQSPVCGRDDGIPNRVDRIKALGNAIVPQVAMELFRSIIEVENANLHI